MPNYQNGAIYSIRSYQTDDIYIGSTTIGLSARMAKHRDDYKHYLNGKSNYMTSYEILQYPDSYIELIENYPCETKQDLNKREGHYIRSTDCVNRCIAGRTRAEYRRDNAESIKLQKK